MSIDWNKLKSNAKAKDDAQYEAMKKDTETIRKASEPKAVERVTKAVSGAAKSSASGWVNTGGTVLDLFGLGSKNTSSEGRRATQEESNAQHYREMLERGTLDNGEAIDAATRARLEALIANSEKSAKVYSEANEAIHAPNRQAVQNLQSTADKLSASAEADIAKAKQGLGKGGQFAVDVGVAGTQLIGDALTGGLLATGVRTFGSGAQEARQAGADLGKQIGYGAGSAAVGVATEKIANVAGPFKKAFGSGVLDKALTKMTAKPAGKLVVSALSEGGEEFIDALTQPILQQLTYNPDAAYDEDWLAEALYSAAVGSVLGGAGGAVDVATAKPTAQTIAEAQAEAKPETVDTQKEKPAESVSEAPAKPVSDPLLESILGGKRVDQSKATNEQFSAMADRGDVGIDSAGKLYKINPEHHIDNRTADGVKGMNAFQFDHPELHQYYQKAAEALIADAEISNQFGMDKRYERTMQGNKVVQKAQTSQHLRKAMDETGLTRNQIIDAAQRIVHDKGQENVQAAKQIEVILDSMLTDGWDPMMGDSVAPNDAYIAAKSDILGSKLEEEFEPLSDMSVGAAKSGFMTPESVSKEKTSRIAETTAGYNRVEGEATGLNAEQYAELMKYKTMTEAMATQQADDMVYVNINGKRTFLMNANEEAYNAITEWLEVAPAWDAPMTDAAYMIRDELKGKSVNGEITQEEYVKWLEVIREHSTAGGQGVQAQAKWSRTDNQGGVSTELDAAKALENSKLPPEEQKRIFNQIVRWDMEIENTPVGDTAALKEIIMRVANERGVVNGLMGGTFDKIARSALDGLTFDQMKQFAYSSTAALANDSTPANIGQKIKTIQIMNMLSKPSTPAKNLTGNTSFYGIDALAMNGASVIDMAVAKLTGTRSIAAEKLPSLSGAAKAMQMSIAEITLDVDMGGEKNRYGTGSSRTFKSGGTGVMNTNTAADKFVERVISALERNQAYLMVATDEFYKGAARATQKNTQALIDSGKIKTSDKEYAKDRAEELALYRTFQDKSKLSVAIQQFHDILNLIGVGDSGKQLGGLTVHSFGAGDIVAPFTKVAGNLVSRGLEYSPINATKGVIEIVGQVANAAGKKIVDPAKQAKGVSDLARGLTGSAIAYGFMQLVQAGLMKRAEDENDKDAAALNQSEGMRGTQINLSATERALKGGSPDWKYGDTLVDLSSIEPLNLLMNLGAEMAKSPKNPIVSSFGATVDSFGAASSELPVLQSIGDFTTDVFKYGKDWKESAAEQVANTVVSSLVPNLVSGIAKGMDDRPRNTRTGDDLWDYIQDSFKNKIPGLRETLPGSVNSLGEAKTYQGSEDSLLASLFSPVGINTYTQSAVSKEMERVREATGDVTFYPESTIPKKVGYDNKEIQMNYKQRQKYQTVRGTVQEDVTAQMMSSSAYKKASAAEQAALLDRCKSYATQMAREAVAGPDAVETWAKNAKNAQKDLNMSAVEYMELYEKYGHNYLTGDAYEKTKQIANANVSVEEYILARKNTVDTDKSGGINKDEFIAALNARNFTQSEKRQIFSILHPTWKNPF